MLAQPNRTGSVSRTARTAVDAKLMDRSGIDELSLRRLRKAFMARIARLTSKQWQALAQGGTCPRFQFMISTMESTWSEDRWNAWLGYLEHSQQDIREMCAGEYPISPYLVRVFSALFGIKVEFLLLGTAPSVDRYGASIDVWPKSGTR